jgi:hypothetical protein
LRKKADDVLLDGNSVTIDGVDYPIAKPVAELIFNLSIERDELWKLVGHSQMRKRGEALQ